MSSFNIRSVESCTAADYQCRPDSSYRLFQYSLCRIVYCCSLDDDPLGLAGAVSIFALSNRVLLQGMVGNNASYVRCFNIRSVESCTAAVDNNNAVRAVHTFQYSLCRIVYCCLHCLLRRVCELPVSIFALSNRVLLRAGIADLAGKQGVSIFALSNRVLLLSNVMHWLDVNECFNIRSVESCTAATDWGSYIAALPWFQYSLCRIVYCCVIAGSLDAGAQRVSIFALSNRVLLHSGSDTVVNVVNNVSIFALSNRVLLHADSGDRGTYGAVSIFALSNRVLLLHRRGHGNQLGQRFNIRSVESCTAA